MKRIITALLSLMMVSAISAQTLNVHTDYVTYQYAAAEVGDVDYLSGTSLIALGKSFALKDVKSMQVTDEEVTPNQVSVAYSESSAHVKVAGNIAKYVTVEVSGAHVSIVQSDEVNDEVGEISYVLSGTSADGEFYMSGSYKATVEFNGLTLTNATPVYSGAAVCVMDGKRVNIKVVTGTTNTLTDAASGNQKACLYVKGHVEFKQKGTLKVVGNYAHAIKAGEYLTIKNADIQVLSAVGDGVNCSEYFLMESGSLNIAKVGDEGIQCDVDGDASTGETANHEGEDSGNIYITGGVITVSAPRSEGIESKGAMTITGGEIKVEAYDDAINSSQDMTIEGGYIYARGSNNDGLDSNGNLYIKGGLVYAIGARSPEVAVDANTEQNKKFYFTGGTLVAIGGLENGSQLSQSCYSTSSWNTNTWYAMTLDDQTIAFKTPASAGSTLVVSSSSTPALKSGVTVSGGTEILDGMIFLNATTTGGSSVTLSSYTSSQGGSPGGGGFPGGGRPGGWW